MDYELTAVGCNRLAESTVEERGVATEKVLKNLEEHQSYYSALIQFEGGMNQGSKITESSFKKYLEENFPNTAGTGMICVKKEFKDDKMTELKEAIKREIKNIVSESNSVDSKSHKKDRLAKHKSMSDFAKNDKDFDGPSDKDTNKKAVSNAKTKARELAQLDKDEKKAKDRKKELQNKFKPLMTKYNEDGDKAAYEKAVGGIPEEIKKLNIELKDFIQKREDIALKEKTDKRAVAEMAMDKDVHLEILSIIKEHGVNLREGAESIRIHYEIAKTAYMEGLTAGMKIN